MAPKKKHGKAPPPQAYPDHRLHAARAAHPEWFPTRVMRVVARPDTVPATLAPHLDRLQRYYASKAVLLHDLRRQGALLWTSKFLWDASVDDVLYPLIVVIITEVNQAGALETHVLLEFYETGTDPAATRAHAAYLTQGDQALPDPALHARGSCANPACPLMEAGMAGRIRVKVCSRCHTTRYCSRSCQLVDWKQHKTACSV